MKHYGDLDRVYSILDKYATTRYPTDKDDEYTMGIYDGILEAMSEVENIKADIILLEEGEQL